MTLRHLTTRMGARLALGALATATAATALVGVSAATAAAPGQSATSNYDCSALGSSQGSFPLTVTLGLPLPSTAPAGYGVPAGFLGYSGSLALNPTQYGTLNSFGVNGGSSSDFAFSFGSGKVVAPATFGAPTPTSGGAGTIPVSGANGAFQLPAAGSYDVKMPTTFTIVPTHDGAPLPANLVCTSAAPASLASVTLSKQTSKVKAKAPKTVKQGAKAKVVVSVSNEFVKTGGVVASGKVVVLDGKKVVGSGKLKKGKVKITLKTLSKGKHTLTAVYKGDKYDNGSSSKALHVTQK